MELAKMTSKGQITVPVAIRKRLNLDTGDKLAFLDAGDRIMVVNVKTIEKGEMSIE